MSTLKSKEPVMPSMPRELTSTQQANLASHADDVARARLAYLKILDTLENHTEIEDLLLWQTYHNRDRDFEERWPGYEWIEHCEKGFRDEIKRLEAKL